MKTTILSIALIIFGLSLSGCGKPAVQTAYDFSLSSWHLPNSAKNGDEIEIRFYLTRAGDFRDAAYRFGYIQLDGRGRLYNTNRVIYPSREEHPLEAVPDLDTSNPKRWVYTLTYRHLGPNKSSLRFFVIDNFGNQRTYDVEINPDTSITEK